MSVCVCVSVSVCVSVCLCVCVFVLMYGVCCGICSEPESCVEGAGGPATPLQPHVRAVALLCVDPDHGVPQLPGPRLRLGAASELVREMDTSLRVSGPGLLQHIEQVLH